MNRRTKITLSLVAAAVVVVAGAGVAVAGGGGDSEPPISGAALDRATSAALDHTGGGRVTETEVGGGQVTETEGGDEESYYEVEVTLDDGRRVDVALDPEFRVVGSETDGPSEDDDD
jgi:hypothetical protein